jgi:hypothetical protein
MIDDPNKFTDFSNKWAPGNDPKTEEYFLYAVLRDVHLYKEETSETDAEIKLLKFLGANSGLKLFRGSSTSNNWIPLSIDDSDRVIELPCY